MAKRRKLEAPSADDLSQMEEAFRRETPAPGPGAAPIAQVASESAMKMDVITPDTRRTLAELERFRAAEGKGLVARDIPIDDIDATALTRDRVVIDPEAFRELKASIVLNGLRMPIEVFEVPDRAPDQKRYGLISGYRRLLAVGELRGQPGQAPGVIEAFIRQPKSDAAHMEAMIEENEIRAALSHYERGRVSVLAAQAGFYESVEAAVAHLFRFASKAKRSKIRSFAVIHEELGDLLTFPQALTEKQGLKLVAMLRDGQGTRLRETLSQGAPATAADEWAVLEMALAPRNTSPKAPDRDVLDTYVSDAGTGFQWARTATGFALRIDGEVSDDLREEIASLLTKRLG